MLIDVENLKPGQRVRLSFRLPSSGTVIDADGSVVWVAEKRQGIRFEHVKNVEAIREFITEIENMDGIGG